MAVGAADAVEGALVLVETTGLEEPDEVVAGVLEEAVVVGLEVVVVVVVVVLRSMTPVPALPLEDWVAPVPAESEPPAPHADKATQHASADTADPRGRSIDGLGREVDIDAFRQRLAMSTMSWKCDYVFVSMHLSGSNISRIRRSHARSILDGIIGSRCQNATCVNVVKPHDTRARVGKFEEAPGTGPIFELTHRIAAFECAAKIAVL